MVKKLLFGLSLIALSFIACKKQDAFIAQSENQSNQKTIYDLTQVQPVPAPSPKLFFVVPSKDVINIDTLYTVSNLADVKPTVMPKKSMMAIKGLNGTWAFNKSTDEITTLGSLATLDKFSTSKFTSRSISTQGKQYHYDLRISPDNSIFYCVGGEFNNSILRGNVADGNGLVTVLNDPSIRITALDIDYVNNRAYFVDAVTNRIYCVSLKGGNKIFVSMISSTTSVQTCGEVNIRVDPTLEKIYLSSIGTTVNGVPGKLKLWSLNTSGQNWTTLMETVTEPGISISLDILQGKKLFYCLYKPSSKTSVLNCINMYGVESPLMSLSNKIENIVVGMP